VTFRLVLVAVLATIATSAAPAVGSAPALARCTARQLKLSGSVSGATQSLLGTLTLANRTLRACALPVAPQRVSLMIGTQTLPTLTVRWRRGGPQGTPTRRLAGHGHVTLGVQWRNWCGAPRGKVHLALAVTLVDPVTVKMDLRTVTTPPCVDHRYSSRVAVTRFLA
jgi:hypothetical protein